MEYCRINLMIKLRYHHTRKYSSFKKQNYEYFYKKCNTNKKFLNLAQKVHEI